MPKSLISIDDLTEKEILKILAKISYFKKKKKVIKHTGKSVGLLFEKFSTRTRLSFESAIAKLGANPIFINKQDTQLSRGESIVETARMFSFYLDALVYRTDSDSKINDFNKASDIPIINALSDLEHPTQIISDIFTIKETFNKKNIRKINISYIGDANNIAISFAKIARILKLKFTFCCPKKYSKPLAKIINDKTGLSLTADTNEAFYNADVIYTDVWTSMGMEKENAIRLKDFKKYQVTKILMEKTSNKSVFMHCLPAHIGEEVTSDVINSDKSIVYQQAENKLYSAMAIIDFFLS